MKMTLNDDELNSKLRTIAAEERMLTQIAVEHIAEVDIRKLYLKLGYPSMYEYLISEIGYSEGCAQRRIDAARLYQMVPEVSEMLKEGRVTLSQITKAKQIFRQVKKETQELVPLQIQKQILKKMENKSVRETDLILAQEFNIKVESKDKCKIQKDESVRVELTFSKEEMELIKKAQELLSTKTGGRLKDTLVETAKRVIKEFEPKKSATAVAATKSVTPKLKREILKRDQCCQFRDLKTNRVCGAKLFLEVDHVLPRFAGGSHDPKNLRMLCRNHNQFRYRAEL